MAGCNHIPGTRGGFQIPSSSSSAREQPEEVDEGGEEGGYVGEGGGVESFVDAFFLAGGDDAEGGEFALGAAARVILHGERDEVEECEHGIADDAEGNQAEDFEKESAEDNEGEELRGDLRDGDERHAES